MIENFKSEQLTEEDVNFIASTEGVKKNTVRKLFIGGVSVEDIEEVISIRNSLSEITFPYFEEDPKGKTDIASVKSILRAYQACDGDMEMFRQIAEGAMRIAAEIGPVKKDTTTRPEDRHVYTKALNMSIENFLDGI